MPTQRITQNTQINSIQPYYQHISGLQMGWQSSGTLTISAGSAWIPGISDFLIVTGTITYQWTNPLPVSAFQHIYLYNKNGVAALEVTGTSPSPYISNSYTKQNDLSKRYIGSVLIDSNGYMLNFDHNSTYGSVLYRQAQDTSPFRVLSNGKTAIPNISSVALSSVVPSTSKIANIHVTNSDSTFFVYMTNSEASINPVVSIDGIVVVNSGLSPYLPTFPLDSSQNLQYTYRSTPTNGFYIDVYGYYFQR